MFLSKFFPVSFAYKNLVTASRTGTTSGLLISRDFKCTEMESISHLFSHSHFYGSNNRKI